jgi:hypothetical protein
MLERRATRPQPHDYFTRVTGTSPAKWSTCVETEPSSSPANAAQSPCPHDNVISLLFACDPVDHRRW